MLYSYNKSTDPYFNLAAEEYMLCNQTEDIFMLWQNRDAIIVGQNQNTAAEINRTFVEEHSIAVVRRITGGGAVFHDLGNLNFTFIQNDREGADFAYFGNIIIGALRTLGINASLSGRNDLEIDGRKFSGNARTVKNGRVLHHGTMMLNIALSKLAGALNVSPEKIAGKGVKSVRSRVTNINEHLEEPISVDRLIDAISGYIARQYSEIEPYEFTPEDLTSINALCEQKYRTYEWNYGKSPAYNFTGKHKFTGGNLEARLNVAGGVITNAAIYGDFFSRADVSLLAAQLIGARHESAALRDLLSGMDIDMYINGAVAENLLAALI